MEMKERVSYKVMKGMEWLETAQSGVVRWKGFSLA